MIIAPLVFIMVSAMSYADIYRYVDEEGIVHFTDVPPGSEYKYERIISEEEKDDYLYIVEDMARKYNIEPSLIRAIIEAESRGDPLAVSRKGAMGLMQLMPQTAAELDVRNPFSPEENIEGGVRYLKYLLDRFNGDLRLAIAAYNAGPKTVEKFGTIPPIKETLQYVEKVLSIYRGEDTNEKPTVIYKVILNDGTILYTNTPDTYQNPIRIRR